MQPRPARPKPGGDLAAILDNADAPALLARLWALRANGRPGYPLRAMWRAYVASFVLNMASTNALIRRLQDDPWLRHLCGFRGPLPHRTTFNRFIHRLAGEATLVEQVFAGLTEQLRERLPDLGDHVAIDSTIVRSHSNPNRHRGASDPEATWTAKNDGKDWYRGYKAHAVACATHGIPLGVVVTTASRSDSPELPTVVDRTRATHGWFRPTVGIADRGYFGRANDRYLADLGIIPIIPNPRPGNSSKRYDGLYTEEGVPTCMGNVPMEYAQTNAQGHRLYVCREQGCHLAKKGRGGITYCDTEVWEDPRRNPWLSGRIRRGSPEWEALYTKRQAIERVFKSLKQSRRLERHCVRGLRQVRLHVLMAFMVGQATTLANLQAGRTAALRWQCRQVA